MVLVAAAAAAVPACGRTALASFTGKCTKVTVMNVETDPGLCSDKITNIKLDNGASGFAFLLHPQAGLGPFVVSFVGAKPRHVRHRNGAMVLPIHRVYVTFDGRTDDLVAVGSCAVSGTNGKAPARLSCTANTIEGNFTGAFIGTAHETGPAPTVTDRHGGHETASAMLVCGPQQVDSNGKHRTDAEGCVSAGRQQSR
jgi:hypothetical protein